jgi:hypothetical protein
MKALIFGPSGSGKTYVARALQKMGINAFDDGDITGLSAWLDQDGKEVAEPRTADEAAANRYAFLWSRKILAAFLDRYSDVYVFGGSGNVPRMLDLFDRVYFLHVEPALQKTRLLSPSRPTPAMDKNEEGLVIWGGWFEEFARQQQIPFIDAALTPGEIYQIITH